MDIFISWTAIFSYFDDIISHFNEQSIHTNNISYSLFEY